MRKSIFFVLVAACSGPQAGSDAEALACRDTRVSARLPAVLSEASGVAASLSAPGIFWVHNDDDALLYAIDSTGTPKATVRVPVTGDTDWEDIAAAPCAGGSCLYIGDIGDNLQQRKRRAVLRIAEPALTDTVSEAPVRFYFRMPDKSHDSEALAVLPDGRMYIITKGRSGPVIVFRFAAKADETSILEPLTTLTEGLVQLPDMVTGAAAVPGQNAILVRTYSGLQLYRLDNEEFVAAKSVPYDLRPLGEPQGEGVTVREDGTVFLVSEQSMEAAPLLSRTKCVLD